MQLIRKGLPLIGTIGCDNVDDLVDQNALAGGTAGMNAIVTVGVIRSPVAEDPDLVRRWIAIIIACPSVLNSVLGGIQLKIQRVIAEFLGDRLGLSSDALVPTMMAAAAGGVIQAAHVDWYLNGGDLAAKVSEGFTVLEQGPALSIAPGRRAETA